MYKAGYFSFTEGDPIKAFAPGLQNPLSGLAPRTGRSMVPVSTQETDYLYK